MSGATLPERSPYLLRRPLPARRRPRRWRTLLTVGGALLQALILVGAPLALGVWMALSPYFLVDEVVVEGSERVSAEWVEESLASLEGRHILSVSLHAVRERVASHPWLHGVEVHKELPRRLVVRVVERQPVARLESDGGELIFLDAEGWRIAVCLQDDPWPELPILRWEGEGAVPVAGALAVLEELAALRPSWVDTLQRVEILPDGDFRLETGALPHRLVVRGGTLASALPRLARAFEEIESRPESMVEVDLRHPWRIVFRPAPASEAAVEGSRRSVMTEAEG